MTSKPMKIMFVLWFFFLENILKQYILKKILTNFNTKKTSFKKVFERVVMVAF